MIALLHTNARKYRCNQCGQTFARKDYLTRHVKSHYIRIPEGFKCSYPKCGMTFDTNKGLNFHCRLHTSIADDEIKIVQPVAGSKQKFMNGFDHTISYRCVWPTCLKFFNSVGNMKIHGTSPKLLI